MQRAFGHIENAVIHAVREHTPDYRRAELHHRDDAHHRRRHQSWMALIGDIRKYMEIEPGDADLGHAESTGNEPEDRRAQRFAPAPLDIVGAGALGELTLGWLGCRFFHFDRAAVGQQSHFFRGATHKQYRRRNHQQKGENAEDDPRAAPADIKHQRRRHHRHADFG